MPAPTSGAGGAGLGRGQNVPVRGKTCAQHPASPLLRKGSIGAPQLSRCISRIPWTKSLASRSALSLNICMYSCRGGGIVASEMMFFSSYCPFLTTLLGRFNHDSSWFLVVVVLLSLLLAESLRAFGQEQRASLSCFCDLQTEGPMLFPLCVPPPTSVCPSSSFVTMTSSLSKETLLAVSPVGNLCLGESFLSGFRAFLCLTPTSQHLTQPCRHPRAPSSSAGPTSARPPPGAVLPSLCSLRRRTKGPLVLAQALGWVGISQHPALLEVLDAGLCLSCLVPQAALPPRALSRRESAEERGYAERIWQEQH